MPLAGIEPISARNLHNHLVAQGCSFHHQVGSHLTGTAPGGATIRIPDPGSNHPVTTLVTKELGRAFGKNLYHTRLWLGYGRPESGKPPPKKPRGPVEPPFQKRVVTAARDIERTSIRITLTGKRTLNAKAVKKLESLAGQLKACQQELIEGAA